MSLRENGGGGGQRWLFFRLQILWFAETFAKMVATLKVNIHSLTVQQSTCNYSFLKSMWSRSPENIKFNLNLIMNFSLFIKFWSCNSCKIFHIQFAILSNTLWINLVQIKILMKYTIIFLQNRRIVTFLKIILDEMKYFSNNLMRWIGNPSNTT